MYSEARIISHSTRRDEIVHIASCLFKDKGYAATTMREIAEKIGIEAASMYNHIKGKDEILHDICFRIARAYEQKMSEILESPMDTIDSVKHIIRSHIDIICQDPNGVSVANHEWKHLSEPAHSEYKMARDKYEAQILAILEKGIKEGVIQNLPPHIILYTILSALRWVEIAYKPGKEWKPELLEDTISTILLQGIVSKENLNP